MKEYYESTLAESDGDFYEEIESLIRKSGWTWQAVCAVGCLVGGVSAPFLGATFDVTSWFTESQPVISRLHVLSIISCALTIPLLALGGCCLDLLEKKAGQAW
jgi:hypothetical protein